MLFCIIITVCVAALSWKRTILLVTSADCFSTKILWTNCSCWTYKWAFNVSLVFQNSKWIIDRISYLTAGFTYFSGCSGFVVSCGKFSMSMHIICFEHCRLLLVMYSKLILTNQVSLIISKLLIIPDW